MIVNSWFYLFFFCSEGPFILLFIIVSVNYNVLNLLIFPLVIESTYIKKTNKLTKTCLKEDLLFLFPRSITRQSAALSATQHAIPPECGGVANGRILKTAS